MKLSTSVYLTSTNSKSYKALQKFSCGVESVGDKCNLVWEDKIVDSDCAVIMWSPKIVDGAEETKFRVEVFQHYREQNKPVVIIETPIIRIPKFHRFYQYRVGLNDVTRLGCFANTNKSDTRWKNLNLSLAPWKLKGTKFVVCGQYPSDYSLGGIDINRWVENTIYQMKRNTSFEIVYKPHPVSLKHGLSGPTLRRIRTVNTIDWNDVRATVTYSSGMAIDSLMNGVPCITMSERNFAWNYSTHNIQRPHSLSCPHDRQQLFNDLAYAQWSLLEFETGECWKNLRQSVIENPQLGVSSNG